MTCTDHKHLPTAADRPLPPPSRYRTSHPCDAVLVLDCSESMGDPIGSGSKIAAEKKAALAYIDERAADHNSRIAVVGFHDVAREVCPLTEVADRITLGKAIRSLRAKKLTNMLAGLAQAEQSLLNANDPCRHREIVFLTDGFNTGSCPLSVSNRIKERGCLIYTVGIGEAPENVDEELLKRIASVDNAGRPLYRFFDDRSRLVRHFDDLGRITR